MYIVGPFTVLFPSDINECKANTHNCDVAAICVNTKGSYNCTCKAGYSGDGQSCAGMLTLLFFVK